MVKLCIVHKLCVVSSQLDAERLLVRQYKLLCRFLAVHTGLQYKQYTMSTQCDISSTPVGPTCNDMPGPTCSLVNGRAAMQLGEWHFGMYGATWSDSHSQYPCTSQCSTCSVQSLQTSHSAGSSSSHQGNKLSSQDHTQPVRGHTLKWHTAQFRHTVHTLL